MAAGFSGDVSRVYQRVGFVHLGCMQGLVWSQFVRFGRVHIGVRVLVSR